MQMEETNLKSLVVSPGQTLLFISKYSLDAQELDHTCTLLKNTLPTNIRFLVVDGTQFEVAVLDDRRIESYVPEFMNDEP